MTQVRLVWDGKSADVPQLHLPLQVVETVNSPRADRGTLFEPSMAAGVEPPGSDGWRNRLIWGDNLHVLSSLADELAGQVDLIYIDPPFDSRQDYKVRIGIGEAGNIDQELSKISSVVEEKAYRDTWGAGVDSYLQMLYARIVLLREVLSDRGSLFLHLAPNVSHYARAILDEVFGSDNFRAEIVWKRTTAHSDGGQGSRKYGPVHDNILYYSKSENFIWNPPVTEHDWEYLEKKYSNVEPESGRRYRLDNLTGPGGAAKGNPYYEVLGVSRYWRLSESRMRDFLAAGRIVQTKPGGVPQFKRYLDESEGASVQDMWDDVRPVNSQAKERLGYDTQKPESLVERIVKSSSNSDSIVLDCFVGSGTTPAVAERLGRRWIAVDVGRFAVHTTRKRLLDVPQCKPFVVANLGRYERQVWQAATTGEEFRAYLDFVVELYGATPLEGFVFLHGNIGKRAVHVGAVDAAVSHAEVKDALDEARAAGYHSVEVLGWEFELGLHEFVQELGLHEFVQQEAKAYGVNLILRRIPNEVMDPRTIAANEVVFHELAHVAVSHVITKRRLVVSLEGFDLPNPELVPKTVREKINAWSDYIDYWAIDFTYGSQAENSHGGLDTFRNSWQSYRTRASRSLELSATYAYDAPGSYTVLIKVVDVFGNDTTVSRPVTVG